MKISIVGAGKVGVAYAVFLASKGHDVTAIDKNDAADSAGTSTPTFDSGLEKKKRRTTQRATCA